MTIEFKRGDTLRIEDITLVDDNGAQITDLSDLSIRCQARTAIANSLAIDFIVEKGTDSFTLDAGDTKECPTGYLKADIEYTTISTGEIVSTADFTIKCVEDRTI